MSLRGSFPLESSQYELIHFLGSDDISNIYVARCMTNGKMVAIRQIYLDHVNQEKLDVVRRDITIWSTIEHPNMVSYLCSFEENSVLWFITEYVNGGSVMDILNFSYQRGIKDEALLASIIKDVLIFLEYYHGQYKIHRALKPNNILLGIDGEVKVGGFWITSELRTMGTRLNARFSVLGASPYSAPEVVIGSGHNEKADIWSLGITAIEIATGSVPYENVSEMDQLHGFMEKEVPGLSEREKFSSSFRDFVKQCLVIKPEKRPSAKDLLAHKFLKKAKDSSYIANMLMSQIPPVQQRLEYYKDVPNSLEPVPKGEEIEFVFPCYDDAPSEEPKREGSEKTLTVQRGRFMITKRVTDL